MKSDVKDQQHKWKTLFCPQRENPDRIEGKLVAINPPGLKRNSPRCSSAFWLAAAVIPESDKGASRRVRQLHQLHQLHQLQHLQHLHPCWAAWRAGRTSARRSPKSRCYLRALGSTSPGCTAPGSGLKASPSPTCWAWSRTCRPGSSPEAPRGPPPDPARSLREPAAGWAGSPSREGRCRSASGSCAALRRSSPPELRASCRDTCRCCRPELTATTCTTWRPSGTITLVRLGSARLQSAAVLLMCCSKRIL